MLAQVEKVSTFWARVLIGSFEGMSRVSGARGEGFCSRV